MCFIKKYIYEDDSNTQTFNEECNQELVKLNAHVFALFYFSKPLA